MTEHPLPAGTEGRRFEVAGCDVYLLVPPDAASLAECIVYVAPGIPTGAARVEYMKWLRGAFNRVRAAQRYTPPAGNA